MEFSITFGFSGFGLVLDFHDTSLADICKLELPSLDSYKVKKRVWPKAFPTIFMMFSAYPSGYFPSDRLPVCYEFLSCYPFRIIRASVGQGNLIVCVKVHHALIILQYLSIKIGLGLGGDLADEYEGPQIDTISKKNQG